jgi:hypothetical protein
MGDADKDWRMQATLDVAEPHASLQSLVQRFRGPNVVEEIRDSVPHDVVITHDAKQLFAYAADATLLASAREAIERTLRHDGVDATIRVSHWDDQLDDWRQTDPPPGGDERRAQSAARDSASAIQTRTVVASAGKLVRAQFEQSLRDWADQLGVQCKVIEHPHLLTTQVAFTVTGPARKVDEFLDGVKAEESATIRTETGVMLSPL